MRQVCAACRSGAPDWMCACDEEVFDSDSDGTATSDRQSEESTMIDQLADRCDNATGPDWELDYNIALETGWQQLPMDWRMQRDWKDPRSGAIRPSFPRFSASLDAAMTLVPEGWLVHEISQYTQGTWNAILRGPVVGDNRLYAYARIKRESEWSPAFATPALALCAAALRARQS